MADAMMESLGEANGVKWYWAEPGRFERPGVYYWDGTSNVLCVPYPAKPEAPAQANNLTAELQQRCSDWGVYWRAPDAHGVILTVDQATELLRDALGVEVEVKTPAQAAQSAGEVERGDVVAFEFYNRATGHAIVDYSVNTHVGNLSADKGYEARPLVYASKREEITDGSKPIPLWQAREALDELEAAALGDAPFNHQASAHVANLTKEPQR